MIQPSYIKKNNNNITQKNKTSDTTLPSQTTI